MRPRTDRQTHRRAWPQYISRGLRLTRNVMNNAALSTAILIELSWSWKLRFLRCRRLNVSCNNASRLSLFNCWPIDTVIVQTQLRIVPCRSPANFRIIYLRVFILSSTVSGKFIHPYLTLSYAFVGFHAFIPSTVTSYDCVKCCLYVGIWYTISLLPLATFSIVHIAYCAFILSFIVHCF